LFAKQAKQISIASSCRATFLGMGYFTVPAFEGVQVGQSPEPWRSAYKAHLLSTTWATWRCRPGTVGSICWHGNKCFAFRRVAVGHAPVPANHPIYSGPGDNGTSGGV